MSKLWDSLTRHRQLPRAFVSGFLYALSISAVTAMVWGLYTMGAYNPVATKPPPKGSDDINTRFFKVLLKGRKEGTPFFEIEADVVEMRENFRYVDFKTGETKPHGRFFNMKDWENDLKSNPAPQAGPPVKRTIIWEADEAMFDRTTEDLIMRNNVELLTDANDIVETDEMVWQKGPETLSSSTRTKIHTHKDTLMYGDTIDVKTRDKEMVLEGRVYIEMDVNSDSRIDIKED